MNRQDIRLETRQGKRAITIKLLLILAFIVFTNSGFSGRFELLAAAGHYKTLIAWMVIWAMSIGAVVIASLQPAWPVRTFWAVVLSASTAAGFGYASASGSDMSVFDVIGLWTARHESGRALEFYHNDAMWALAVFVTGFVIIVMPPVPSRRFLRRSLAWLSWTPAVPVAIIAAIVFIKSGGGSQVMPRQFQTLALGAVAGTKLATVEVEPRRDVRIAPTARPAVRNIILLVDESVRADYIDLAPGNPYTPQMAANRDRFVNFGPAASGGNCSAIANAILRLGGASHDLAHSVNTSPTIWQYAKKAGYRTVFIDGQSGFIKNPGKLQNFMTVSETADIDNFVTFENVGSMAELDFRVLAEIEKNLGGDQPVFIYANKNGAHFPYDEGYPASATVFRPTVEATGVRSGPNRVDSYRNVIRWSVDGFFQEFFAKTDLADTAVIYTSDHGQNLGEGKSTHCRMEDPDPREGLVPLMAITGNAALKQRLEASAARDRANTSHFQITPTLLDLMGYAPADVRADHGPSLFEPYDRQPAFAYGDIFGLFNRRTSWQPVDLKADYMEPYGHPRPATEVSATMPATVPALN